MIFIYLILFLSSFLQAFEVNFVDSNTAYIQPGDIVRVDIILTNQSPENLTFISRIDANKWLTAITDGQTVQVHAFSQQILSHYLKVSPMIIEGSYEVTFRFFNSQNNYYITKTFIVRKKEKISWMKKIIYFLTQNQ